MKKLMLLVLIPFGFLLAEGGIENSEKESSPIYNPFKPPAAQSKVYYGGNVGFRFWNNYFYLGVYPLVGYKVTPKFSVGGKLGYAYISDSRYDPTFNTSNYGGSIFTRYRIVPQIYLHGEFMYFSYERISSFNVANNSYNTERVWVPFILLGGGYSQMVSPNVWVFVEVLFDVLQDSNSPYKNWDPFVSFGVGAGF
ncbi:MAG: hypothetical protein KJN64_10255 [Ignavibacteria bacterium]|nr:hypothetical protein [Ignavibacteria bacterium]MBT8383902.1 hypothetical protein [Ignavibacteria bacterium]MBT8390630.1 hypothetical protein [Ignavibacteria bacterium]NNJ51697.1 hypothetical protein [Ignavibacteriaceae bacterium]NNL22280.1 hypothetical protein [Ignavibacteriaceae bacterium]